MIAAHRFWPKIRRDGACLVWTAYKNRKGYGEFSISPSQSALAHRVAWFLTYGYWPTDCLLHSCDTPACVNPEHLREGSRTENNAEMYAKGRGRPGATLAARRACARGHEFTEANTRVYQGYRCCRTCDRERGRLVRARARAAVP